MYKQISFVITAAIILTAFVTVALYTGSEANAPAMANMTKNSTVAAGANMKERD
ncbi:MAG: hypothetical protein WCC17_02355 [Candidatus Nitrosopolaris sp.]